jgi:hypothetical protein
MSVDQTETPNQFVIRITVLGKRGKPWFKSPLPQLSNKRRKRKRGNTIINSEICNKLNN